MTRAAEARPWSRSGRSALGLAVAAILTCAASPARGQEAEAAIQVQRVKVPVGGRTRVAVPGLISLILTDPERVTLTQLAGGFEVQARSTGDVIVQAITGTGMRVFVIVVLARPVPGPTPGVATSGQLGDHDAARSFWAINRYSVVGQLRSVGDSFATHALTLTGKLGDGDHRVDVGWQSQGLRDHEVSNAHAGWISDDRRRTVELGDVGATVVGSGLLTGMPMLGAQARVDWQPTWAELTLGSLRGRGDRWSFVRPAVAMAAGNRLRSDGGAMAVDVTGDVIGYQSAERSGYLTGAKAVALYDQRTMVEIRTALTGAERTTPLTAEDTAPTTGASVGGAISHTTPDASYAVDYEGNTAGLHDPIAETTHQAGQRAAASLSRKLGAGLTAAASLGHLRTRDPSAGILTGTTLSTGLTAAVGSDTVVSISHRESMLPRPVVVDSPVAASANLHRRQLTLAAARQLDPTTRVDGRLVHDFLRMAGGVARSYSATASAARLRDNRWAVQGSASTSATRAEVSGQDAGWTVQSNVAASAQVIRGPIQLTGSAGVQQILAPTARTRLNASAGVRFTPTTATQLSAQVDGSRELDGSVRYGATLGLTHYFGDAVRARPLLQVMTDGVIEGVLCVDADADGECARGEAPLAGIAVRLSPGRRARSDADGRYRFGEVAPGVYTLEVDEDALRAQGRLTTTSRIEVVLDGGKTERTRFAVTRGCELTGAVIHDRDMDGQRTDADGLLAGVGVTIVGPGGTFEARTDGLGGFRAILPECGRYTVTLDPGSLPESMMPVVEEATVELTPSEGRGAVALMAHALRTLQGTVFVDGNRNGVRDADEAPVAGATVRWNGGELTTDEDGAFLLRRLPPGTIKLRVGFGGLPEGATPGRPAEVTFEDGPATIALELPINVSTR